MFKIRQFLTALSLCLFSLALSAQTVVNLAAISEVNVTLSEQCGATLTLDQVLTGDFNEAPFSAFTLVVQDGTISNGAIIDGCGRFIWTATADPAQILGFTTAWGYVNAEDKTSPLATFVPESPEGLYCDQISAIDINTLPASTNRCWVAAKGTGLPIAAGFANTPLGQRLIAGGGIPRFFDGCSNVTICVNDIVIGADMCEGTIIRRVFTATDGDCPSVSGEQNAPAVAEYDIFFTRPTVVEGVAETVEYSCLDFTVAQPNPVPAVTDYPYVTRINGTRIYLNNSFCNFGATYSDGPRVITCANTYKFVRTYTVIDWCNPGQVQTFTQLVKVGDFDAPVITLPTQDLNFDGVADAYPLEFTTNSAVCTAFFVVPAGSATDNCDANPTVSVKVYPNGNLSATPFGPFAVGQIAGGFPIGTHIMRYTAVDNCGNESFSDVPFRVVDKTAPTAICEDGLNISVDGNGNVQLCATTIDGGSSDDCSAVTLAIARVGNNSQPLSGQTYQNCLSLNCSNLGNVRVGLRVTDAVGNVNFCWLDVLLEDKLRPTCIAPTPRTVLCSELDGTFPENVATAFSANPAATAALLNARFGEANGVDNCPGAVVTAVSVVDGRNSCGVGTIQRSFRVTDAVGLVSAGLCQQVITVLAIHDYTIVFPGDADSNTCVEPGYNGVTFTENGCDLITIATSVDTFVATADECYKLRITYEVLNWCEWNGEDDGYIIPRDADNDNDLLERTWLHVIPRNTATLTDDLAFLDRDNIRTNTNTIANLDNGDPSGIRPGTNAGGYGVDRSRGSFLYRQFIKVYDNVAPVITVVTPAEPFCDPAAQCVADVTLNFSATDECSNASIRLTASLDAFRDAGADGIYTLADFVASSNVTSAISRVSGDDYRIFMPSLPVGEHAVRITANDGCGNTSVSLILFEVIDCKAPTPICINGLTVTLMPDGQGGGMAEIWASDFIASPSTDCSGPVRFAIYRAVDAAAAGFVPSTSAVGLTLTCNDDATTIVRIYAIDPEGNADYCETTLLVQQHVPGLCAGGGSIGYLSGVITTPAAGVVPGVTVSITGATNSITSTDGGGAYTFTGLTLGNDYTITPELGSYDHHINGVSTFDLVLISRHILGLNALISPYQLIAADANSDRNISVQDIIAVRRFILGLDAAYTSSPAWRFVDANFNFPVNANPWATTFPEVFNVNNLPGDILNGNFVAVMIGNVDGNGLDNLAATATGRSNSRHELLTADQELVAGNTYTVDFTASDAARLEGFQGTIELANGLTFDRLIFGALQAGNFNTAAAERGLINMSYHVAGQTLAAGEVLFSLVVRAEQDAKLSDLVAIGSGSVRAEAYTTGGQQHQLELGFVGQSLAAGFELLQNTPNPVMDVTRIGFSLPTAAEVSLMVQDVQGRTILVRQIEGAAGYNVTDLNVADFKGATGLLTYTIVAGDFIATKKMVVVR